MGAKPSTRPSEAIVASTASMDAAVRGMILLRLQVPSSPDPFFAAKKVRQK